MADTPQEPRSQPSSPVKGLQAPSSPTKGLQAPSETFDVDTLRPNLFCEFLEIAIHAILYHRELYPAAFFERKQKYEIPVWIASHPALKAYVDNLMLSVLPLMEIEAVESVILAVLDPKNKLPVERFVFRLGAEEQSESAVSDEFPEDETEFCSRLGEVMKAFLLKIAACKSYMKPLPPGCSCVLQMVTDSESQALLSEHEHSKKFPWVEVDDRQSSIPQGRTQPVRGPVAGVCPIELFVDEAPNKFGFALREAAAHKPKPKRPAPPAAAK